MKSAETVYAKMVEQGKLYVLQKAQALKKFPTLRNGSKGLVIGGSLGYEWYKVLLPNGRLIWLHHATWEFVGYVPDNHFVSLACLTRIERAVDAEIQKTKSRRFGFAGLVGLFRKLSVCETPT